MQGGHGGGTRLGTVKQRQDLMDLLLDSTAELEGRTEQD